MLKLYLNRVFTEGRDHWLKRAAEAEAEGALQCAAVRFAFAEDYDNRQAQDLNEQRRRIQVAAFSKG